MNKIIGARLRDRRKALDLTLDELALRANVSKPYLSQLENGDSKRPSAEILYRIAVVLDMSLAELMGKKLILNKDIADSPPPALQEAAMKYGIDNEYIGLLMGFAKRADKNNKSLTVEDWLGMYTTMRKYTDK